MRLKLLPFLAFFCLPAWAQTTANCQRTIVVNVRDRQGNFVPGLSASSFRAMIQGQPADILEAKPHHTPLRVVVMMDASGSMTSSKQKWDLARQLTANMLAALPSATHVGMVVFAQEVVKTIDLNHSPYQIIDQLKELNEPKRLVASKESHTALIDCLLKTFDLFGSPSTGDAIFVVSDGGENRSEASWGKAKRTLFARGARLFAIVLDDAYLQSLEEQEGASYLRSTAEESGGVTIYNHGPELLSEKSLIAESNVLYDEIWHYYELGLEVPRSLAKEGKLDLEVVDAAQKKAGNYRIMHPRRMSGCSGRLILQ